MANDNNNAKNLEALAKLKELGITDLSPEAVLTMVQSHLDTQSNLRKDNCQKQKEIDAKKAEIDYGEVPIDGEGADAVRIRA